MGLISWLRNLFKRKQETRYYAEVKGWPQEWKEQNRGVYIPRRLPKPGSQAIQKGYGDHFKGKGKHQHKQYRRSVKARKQPEDENI